MNEDERRAYIAEREAAQAEKIAASADRAMGRRPLDLPGRRRVRTLLGETGPSRTENGYDPMER